MTALPRTFAADGAWCWFQDSRAIEVDGKTTFGWITCHGDVQLAQYDPTTHNLTTTDLQYDTPADDHSTPSIVEMPDGRLMVLWTQHSVAGAPMNFVLTTNPNDISSFGPVGQVPGPATDDKFCYPNPVYVPEDHRLYVFFRSGVHPGYVGLTWTSNYGATWEPTHNLLQNGTQRPYAKFAYDGHGGIHIAVTDANANETTHNNVYYANLHIDPAKNWLALWSADGTFRHYVRDGVYDINATNLDLVQDASDPAIYNGWIWDVASTADGHPVIACVAFPDVTDHWARYASYDPADGWTNRPVVDMGPSISTHPTEPRYSPGWYLDHDDPANFALAQMVGDRREMFTGRTDDRGQTFTWTAVTADSIPVTGGYNEDNVRPMIPRGSTAGPAGLLWMRGSYEYWAQGLWTMRIVGTPDAADTRVKVWLRVSPTGATGAAITAGSPVTIGVRAIDNADNTTYLPSLPMQLWSRVAGQQTWTHVADGTTDSTGLIHWTRTPSATCYYEVRFAGSPSMTPAVSPRARVTVS